MPPRDSDAVTLETRPAPTQANADSVVRARELATLLDDSIRVPGTGYRVGLDPILGLLPVVGDAPAAAAAAYIVAVAASVGVPRATLLRMLVVLFVDAVVGSIPLVGDVFDAAFKANVRNVRLLESRAEHPENVRVDRRFLLAVGAVVFAGLVVVGLVAAAVVVWSLRVLGVLA